MKRVLPVSLIACCLLLTACNDASVGVIGGADGPTSIIVSDNKHTKGQYGEQIEKMSVRMFNADGELYYDSGIKSDIDARCGTLDGELKKKVKENEIPQKSGEANFDAEGYQSATETTKEVCVGGEWLVFKKYDDQPENLKDFKYCFHIKGRLNNAEADSEIIVLSDNNDVTFNDVFEPLLSSQLSVNTDKKVSFNIIAPTDKWGLILYAEDVSTTGMKIKFDQFGGENVGELQTGAWFNLEKSVNETWVPVEANPQLEYAWNDVAYQINKNDITELNVEWDRIYGKLDNGYYRLTKEIMNIQEESLLDKNLYTVYFTIE